MSFVQEASNINADLTIKDSVRNPMGKWPKEIGNVLMMRIDDFQ